MTRGALAEEEDTAAKRFGWREALQSILGLSLAGALLAFGLPRVADTTWQQIGQQLSQVGWQVACLMLLLKVVGLYSYTFTLTASLPGLSHLRAMMVNAAGSMVSNIMPMGGAVAVAITYVMCRSWGFLRRNISTSLVVTGVWNVMARLALPLLAILAVIIGPVDTPAPVILGSSVAVIALLVVLGLFLAVIFTESASQVVGRTLGGVARPFSKRLRAGASLDGLIRDQRSRWGTVASSGGWRMTLGLAGMLGIFFLLYWLACHTVGVDLPLAHIFAAYAIRQLLTVVAITPGGLGITEAGTAAVLIAFGADTTSAAAAALLYAIVTHLLDVPLGAVALLAWWLGPKTPTSMQLGTDGATLAMTGAPAPAAEQASSVESAAGSPSDARPGAAAQRPGEEDDPPSLPLPPDARP